MSRRIYVDLDDVIAETTRRFPAVVQELFGRSKSFEELHTFHLDRAFGLSPDELARLFDHVHHGDFLIELEPREGAVAVLESWDAAGHEIRVVTGRPPESRSHSLEWLARCAVPHSHFHICDKYDRFDVGEEILHLEDVRELDFDWAIEDSLEMAGLLAAWGVEQVLLLDRPWNRDEALLGEELRPRVQRVADWSEIRARLEP
jgi:uncharacterized HAD superfamily protein